MARIASGSITLTDVKGWDGEIPTYSNLKGSIEDVPQLAQLTSGKIKKEDTYTKEEINNLMENMVRFDNQSYIIYKPDPVTNKIRFKVRTDGIHKVNMVIKWSKTDYEYEQWTLGDDELITERTYPDDEQVVIRFTGNVGIQLLEGHLEDVVQWGTSMTKFVFLEGFLKNFIGDKITAQDLLNTSEGISMRSFLENAVNFNQYINRWFPRYPGNLSRCFYNCSSFNQNINNINTMYVTTTANMFYNCTVFNSELYRWSTENVFNMSNMFYGCQSFNQSLDQWDVSQVTDMTSMFENTAVDSKDFSMWNVGNVISYDSFMITSGDNNILPIFV